MPELCDIQYTTLVFLSVDMASWLHGVTSSEYIAIRHGDSGDEGLAWLGTGQYDYDTKDVSLCSLFMTEQEAYACIEEFENNGDDDDDDEDDDDDDDDVDDDDGNDDDEENCIADSTYYHSEEFILDAEE